MAPRLDQPERPSGPLVRGFRGGGFAVEDRVYRALWMTPEAAGEWDPPMLAELGPEHFLQPLALSPPPEFLLLGTGTRLALPPRSLVTALEAQGLGVEAMDSRAAARTWAVLRAEQRWIAAALMPLSG